MTADGPESSPSPTASAHIIAHAVSAVSIDTGGIIMETDPEAKTPKIPAAAENTRFFEGNVCFSPRSHGAQATLETLRLFDTAFGQIGLTGPISVSHVPIESPEKFIIIDSPNNRVEIGMFVDQFQEHREWFAYYAAVQIALATSREGFSQVQILQKVCEYLGKKKPELIVQRILFLLHHILMSDWYTGGATDSDIVIRELQFLITYCTTNNMRIQPIIIEELSHGAIRAVVSIKFGKHTFKKTLSATVHSDHYHDILGTVKKSIDFPTNNHRCC